MKKQKDFVRVLLYITFGTVHFMLICVMIIDLVLSVRGMRLRPQMIYVPYSDSAYYFRGTEENFIKNYRNPYEEEQGELEFICIGKQEGEWADELPRWVMIQQEASEEQKTQYCGLELLDVEMENDSCIIAVRGGGLKRVYYFFPVQEMKTISGEAVTTEKMREQNQIRKIRVVLDSMKSSDAEDAGMTCYYRVKLPQNDVYQYEKELAYNDFYAEYDVLTGGKEIPAHFLQKWNRWHISEVIVERYAKTNDRGGLGQRDGKEIYVRQY